MISRNHEIYARFSDEKFRKVSEFLGPRTMTTDAFINGVVDRFFRGSLAKRKTRTEEPS